MSFSSRASRTRRRLLRGAVVALVPVSVALVAACSDNEQDPGSLVVAVDTNVPLPGYVDSFALEVVQDGVIIYGNSFQVADGPTTDPTEVLLPGTLGVVNAQQAGRPVTVRLVGVSTTNGTPSVVSLREVITTVPSAGTSLLRMAIDGLCFGEPLHNATSTAGVASALDLASLVTTSCPSQQTCVAGGCTDAGVTTLPPYEPTGALADAGTCFPVADCFDDAPADQHGFETITAAGTDCTVPVPMVVAADGSVVPASQDHLNVGIPLPSGDCGGATASCLAPLDLGASTDVPVQGFYVDTTVSPPVIRLPPGLCVPTATVLAHTVLEVSTACVAKTVDHPLCTPGVRFTTKEPAAANGSNVSSTDDDTYAGTILPDGAVAVSSSGGGGGGGDSGSVSGGDDSGTSGGGSDGGGDSGDDGGDDDHEAGSDGGADSGSGTDGGAGMDGGLVPHDSGADGAVSLGHRPGATRAP